MKLRRASILGCLSAVLLAATTAQARGWRHHENVSTSGGGREGVTRCSQWHVEFGDHDAAVAEESVTIPSSEASPLVASPSENGGITVIGSDGKDFEVTLCKAAEDDEAQALAGIRLVRAKGRLSVEGPADAEWTAHLIIHAPRNASVDLETHNGPVSVSDFSGTARISSENGPVSLRRSSGAIEVRTTNGPIHFEGASGKVRLEAENGPLSVHLQNSAWTGGELEGRTQNGPVHLDIAENYASGVLVATAGRSPVHCGAEACRKARRNWDDDGKTIAWGADKPVVRLSTENGPVSIGSRD
jgi:hypothetical protein